MPVTFLGRTTMTIVEIGSSEDGKTFFMRAKLGRGEFRFPLDTVEEARSISAALYREIKVTLAFEVPPLRPTKKRGARHGA